METASVKFHGEGEYRPGAAKVERFYDEAPSTPFASDGSGGTSGRGRCELRFQADDEIEGDLVPELASLDGRFEGGRVIEHERLNGRLFWLRIEQ